MNHEIVIVTSEQFGYHVDSYYYCKYLKSKYEISYICWDHGQLKIEMPGVRVIYIDRGGGLWRMVRFLKQFCKITPSQDVIIFIKYLRIIPSAIWLLRSNKTLILDIRSGSIEPIYLKRIFQDILLKFESKLFNNITVISRSLSKRLRLNNKAHILPLGANIISNDEKNFNELNLLYVGTLYNRKIENAVKGFSQFYKEKKDKCNMRFTIIGSGRDDEIYKIKAISKKTGVSDVVNLLGIIPHEQLKPYFDAHNIGISYVPLTDYYDPQPVTKTFEYLLSGMPVLATSTSENKMIIDESNGVLTDDTPEGFKIGISKIYQNRMAYNSGTIRKNCLKYTWENIVKDLSYYFLTLQAKSRNC